MKKTLLFLSAAALLLAACNKTETVRTEVPEAGNPIAFKAISGGVTKAGELDGELLNANYGIYAAATQKNASGMIENASFFTGDEQLFACADDPMTAASLWKASPAQYWPIGGAKLDFLAYAQLKAQHDGTTEWEPTWDNASTDVASKLSFYGVDTYKAPQEDILYAEANGMTRETESVASSTRAVPMTFKHAQALLIFNVKASVADQITINEISFVTPERVNALRVYQTAKVTYDAAVAAHTAWAGEQTTAYAAIDADGGLDADGKTAAKAEWLAAHAEPAVPAEEPALAALTDADVTLKTVGDFVVNNERNILSAGWKFGADATKAANYKMPSGSAESKANKVLDDAADDDEIVDYDAAVTNTAAYFQLGETLLVPEQEKVNFTIKYTVGGKVMYYTYNDVRGLWKMGSKYYYNLDLDMTEIVITESVVDFTAVDESEDIAL